MALAVILLFLILLLWFRNISFFDISFVLVFDLNVFLVGVEERSFLLLLILIFFPGRACIIFPLGKQGHLVLRF